MAGQRNPSDHVDSSCPRETQMGIVDPFESKDQHGKPGSFGICGWESTDAVRLVTFRQRYITNVREPSILASRKLRWRWRWPKPATAVVCQQVGLRHSTRPNVLIQFCQQAGRLLVEYQCLRSQRPCKGLRRARSSTGLHTSFTKNAHVRHTRVNPACTARIGAHSHASANRVAPQTP